MNNLSDLLAKREALDKQIEEVKISTRAEGFSKIKALLDEYQLTLDEVIAHFGLLGRSKASSQGMLPKAKAKVKAKYLNKETGASWSGRGLRPRWLTTAIEAGAKIEDFTV